MPVAPGVPDTGRDDTVETLATAFNPRSNSLGFLRYFLAALVVVDHAFPLGGFNGGHDPMWGWTKGQESFGGIAVAGFFVISGYLITRSFATAPSVQNFVWRRFLRIFPGFWVCLIVTAFIFAGIAWHHENGAFHGFLAGHPDSPVNYLRHNGLLTMHQYNVDGLLKTTPYAKTGYPMAFDGSLWTLIYEFKCYLGVALLGAFGLVKRGRAVFLGLAVFLWFVQLADVMVPGSAKRAATLFVDPQMVRLPLLFLIGTLLYLYHDKVIISNRFALLAALALGVSFRTGTYAAIGLVALGYLCFWLAIRLPMQRFDAKGDFSYGLYIYAFPVAQLLALYRFNRFGLVPYIGAALVVATALAIVSWKLVEQPCLRLKSFDPVAVIRRWRSSPVIGSSPPPGGGPGALAPQPATIADDVRREDLTQVLHSSAVDWPAREAGVVPAPRQPPLV